MDKKKGTRNKFNNQSNNPPSQLLSVPIQLLKATIVVVALVMFGVIAL
jgi:hypothetical protein